MATPFIQTVRGRNNTEYSRTFPMAATQYINVASGRFVVENGSGYYTLAVTASTQLDGWLYDCYKPDHSGDHATTNASGITTSATAGGTVLTGTDQITTPNDGVWIPGYRTLTIADIGAICDINYTNSGTTAIQTVDPDVSTYDVLKIIEVDLVNNYALVYAYTI